VYENFTYCKLLTAIVCQQTRVMDLSEKSDFILCEIKSSLFHESDHRNGYITTVRSVCDTYHLFGIKVKITTSACMIRLTWLVWFVIWQQRQPNLKAVVVGSGLALDSMHAE